MTTMMMHIRNSNYSGTETPRFEQGTHTQRGSASPNRRELNCFAGRKV